MRYSFLLLMLMITTFSGCGPLTKGQTKLQPKQEEHVITIWIHGTRLLFSRVVKPISYCRKGLHRPDELPDYYQLKVITRALQEFSHERFGSDHVYLFGWSGKLSFEAREEAGKELHSEILRVIRMYKRTHKVTPKIKIITHSHGGNVLFECIEHEHMVQGGLVFDECIILACPVQQKTAHLITSPVIKKAYSLFSTMDTIQVLDPQGIYKEAQKPSPLLSERLFPHADNVRQVQIKTHLRGFMHIDFVRKFFVEKLSKTLDVIDAYHEDHPTKEPIIVKLHSSKPTIKVGVKKKRYKRSLKTK